MPWRSLVTFVLALLSKGLAVALPVALVALDATALGRLPARPWTWTGAASRRVLGEKVPFAAVAALSAIVTVAVARHAMPPLRDMGVGSRLAAAAYGIAFHVEKLAWPADLPIIEPMVDGPSLREPRFGMRLVGLVALGILAALSGRRWPAIPWAFAAHVAFVMPVSGMLQAGPQLAAVRYGYLAAMPLLLLAGAAVALGLHRLGRRGWLAWGALAAASAALLLPLARAEARVWHDGLALWSAAVARRPDAAVARQGLAFVHQRAGRHREAMSELEMGLAAHPAHPDLLTLAALLRAASPDDAVRDAADGVRLARAAVSRTTSPWARWTLAVALASAGDGGAAVGEAERALRDAREQRIPALEAQIERTMPILRAGRPYRLPSR